MYNTPLPSTYVYLLKKENNLVLVHFDKALQNPASEQMTHIHNILKIQCQKMLSEQAIVTQQSKAANNLIDV
jgi:hypothetical protein